MKVLLFRVNIQDYQLPSQGNITYMFDNLTNLYIEAKTGAVVDENTTATTSVVMYGQKIPAIITNVKYTQGTIDDVVNKTNDGLKLANLMGVILPWVLIGVGAILVIIAFVFLGKKKAAPAA